MKTASAATLIVAVFIASVMLTALSLLGSLEQPSGDVRLEDLAAGRLGPMLSGPTFWSRYPSLPPPAALIDYYVMFLVGGLVAALVYLLRIKLQKPLGTLSIAALALGVVPYAQGRLVLQSGAIEPDVCGPWLVVMLLGVLCASLAAAVLASMELTGWHKRTLAWLVRLRRRAALPSPVRQAR